MAEEKSKAEKRADTQAVGADPQSAVAQITGAPGVTFPVAAARVQGVEADKLRRRGIDPDTFERRAVTYQGLIEEFGKPAGPRLYNEIAAAAFGGAQPGHPDLSIITLEDRWISPRTPEESDEEFGKRLGRHRATRAKVQQLFADAEKEA